MNFSGAKFILESDFSYYSSKKSNTIQHYKTIKISFKETLFYSCLRINIFSIFLITLLSHMINGLKCCNSKRKELRLPSNGISGIA